MIRRILDAAQVAAIMYVAVVIVYWTWGAGFIVGTAGWLVFWLMFQWAADLQQRQKARRLLEDR